MRQRIKTGERSWSRPAAQIHSGFPSLQSRRLEGSSQEKMKGEPWKRYRHLGFSPFKKLACHLQQCSPLSKIHSHAELSLNTGTLSLKLRVVHQKWLDLRGKPPMWNKETKEINQKTDGSKKKMLTNILREIIKLTITTANIYTAYYVPGSYSKCLTHIESFNPHRVSNYDPRAKSSLLHEEWFLHF